MNYIRELNAFYDWLDTNPIPATAVALWFTLMAINNKAMWKKEFQVPNSVLYAKAGLSRGQLERARDLLVEKGRITYTPSKRVNQAGTYSIIPIVRYEQQNEQQDHSRLLDMSNRTSNETSTLVKQKQKQETTTKHKQISDGGSNSFTIKNSDDPRYAAFYKLFK